jgi:hypothetical protein
MLFMWRIKEMRLEGLFGGRRGCFCSLLLTRGRNQLLNPVARLGTNADPVIDTI